jgi:hypothetical protein
MPKERSVDKDVDAFCGWDFMLRLVKAGDPFMRGLTATMFETGGRISEVLALQRWNIDPTLNKEVVVVKQMPLLKRFEKKGEVAKWKCVGHCKKRWDSLPSPEEFEVHKIQEYKGWETKSLADYRTFPVRVSEPLTPYMMEWWKQVKGDRRPLFPIKRSVAFTRVRSLGEKLDLEIPFCKVPSSQLYDHWFRAERACQLAFDYGFSREDLEMFFEWKERKPSMAARYASLGWMGLARKMGVKV